MRDVLLDVVDAAGRHASYADARHVVLRQESIGFRNGELGRLDSNDEEGIGIRVRVGGRWGFAACRDTRRAAVEGALARALEVAAAQPAGSGQALAFEPVATGSWSSPLEVDPFEVTLEEKLALLSSAEAVLRAEAGVAVARAHLHSRREDKLFVSTDGAVCEQHLTECGGGLSATTVGPGGAQVRSYPASHSGSIAQGGWEHVVGLDLVGNAQRVAEEARALLEAPACPARQTTVVLGGEQLAMQLHESVGHAVELDRVLGYEASYAGTSWVAPDALGSLRYGAEQMNVTADATLAGGIGSFRWDDEGVAAQAVPIVRQGVLRGFLSSRQSAGEIGLQRSGGCTRAESFARQPIVRMTNVSLDPGDAGSLEDLIASTEHGIYIDTNRSWSIDSRRLHFQFAGEVAWEIEDGRLGRMLRNPVYAGVTPTFWASLDAVCSQSEWQLHSVTNCGKGEPGQYAHVSHGCAPARFRNVQVGLA